MSHSKTAALHAFQKITFDVNNQLEGNLHLNFPAQQQQQQQQNDLQPYILLHRADNGKVVLPILVPPSSQGVYCGYNAFNNDNYTSCDIGIDQYIQNYRKYLTYGLKLCLHTPCHWFVIFDGGHVLWHRLQTEKLNLYHAEELLKLYQEFKKNASAKSQPAPQLLIDLHTQSKCVDMMHPGAAGLNMVLADTASQVTMNHRASLAARELHDVAFL